MCLGQDEVHLYVSLTWSTLAYTGLPYSTLVYPSLVVSIDPYMAIQPTYGSAEI